MHLNSRNKPVQTPVKGPTVVIKQFVDNADGSATIQDYVAPKSVGTIYDWNIENLQNAGMSVDTISGPYIHSDFVDAGAAADVAAAKLNELVSEAEIKEVNNLD